MLTILISKKKKQSLYPKHSKDRTLRLLGKWKGYFEQDDPIDISNRLQTKLEMQFNRKGRIIEGRGLFHNSYGDENVVANLYNGMF